MGEFVSEHDCRERTNEILRAVEKLSQRMFVDNGTTSFQSTMRQHSEAIARLEAVVAQSAQPRTWPDVAKAVCMRAPYATVALVALLLYHEPATTAAKALFRLFAAGG